VENPGKIRNTKKTIATIKTMFTNINIELSIEDAELIFNSISGAKQGSNLAPVLTPNPSCRQDYVHQLVHCVNPTT
jgi:hypothetical protein